MLFSLEWLAEYVDLPTDVDLVCGRLTAAGFNVERREERGDDVVLDLEITTNRSDCMHHGGLARGPRGRWRRVPRAVVRRLQEHDGRGGLRR